MSDKAIKPIETVYKGYRFRSRLEARWAVFFDELGVKWLYEHEGFELPGVGRYLPDFYLPEFDEYVEVKGGHIQLPDTPSVYMAGKMHHGFRRGAGEIEGNYFWSGKEKTKFHYVPDDYKYIKFGSITCLYSGPYSFGVRTKYHVNAHGSEAGCVDDPPRGSIAEWCKGGIDRATVVIGFIDCRTAFGSLVELGYAHAQGKKILLFVDHSKETQHLNDKEDGSYTGEDQSLYDVTWFLQLFTNAETNNYFGKTDGAIETFYQWVESRLGAIPSIKSFLQCEDIQKPIALAHWGKKIHVFAGDPLEHSHWRSMDVGKLTMEMFDPKSVYGGIASPAALKARAARFEFGETGR
jgi:hypothetical protein